MTREQMIDDAVRREAPYMVEFFRDLGFVRPFTSEERWPSSVDSIRATFRRIMKESSHGV